MMKAVLIKLCAFVTAAALAFGIVGSLAACGRNERTTNKIVEELAVYYGGYTTEADDQIDTLLEELRQKDETAADKWTRILQLWKSVDDQVDLHYDVLPDGLPDTDELCIVALGFQLNPDGSMKEELYNRLNVVLNSAKKYLNAYIVCTGGPTATENKDATEAGKMTEWLVANGIENSRVITEDKSLTTAENAIFTYDILTKKYPQVKYLAIISSDYHIATGVLLFGAEAIMQAQTAQDEKLQILSNAAYKAPSGSLSAMFQAGALLEIWGDVDTAYRIYYDEYDIHELPTPR